MEVLVTTAMQVTGDLTADGQRAVGAAVCWNHAYPVNTDTHYI